MTLFLLSHPEAPALLREFQENHLSELEFLLPQRGRYLRDPERPWAAAASLEARISAHLEGLRAGGSVGQECAREWLADGDTDKLMAAALYLASLPPEAGGWVELVRALEDSPEERGPACEGALALAEGPWVARQLTVLLGSPHPHLRASAARLLGWRREGEPERLVWLLNDSAPEVRAAAALALGKQGHRAVLPALERALSARPDSQVEEPLLAGALLLDSPLALRRLREACGRGSDVPRVYPLLLALSGDAQDAARLRVLATSRNPHTARAAVEALGVLGVASTVPLLLEKLEDDWPVLRLEAASALELVTGAGLTERVWVSAPDDEDSPGREQVRPTLDAGAWRSWWMEHRTRFEERRRYRRGQPYTPDSCVEELEEPRRPLIVRARASLELCIGSAQKGQSFAFEADWPIRRQREALARWRIARGTQGG